MKSLFTELSSFRDYKGHFFDLKKYIFDLILAKFWLYFDLTAFAYYLCLVALFWLKMFYNLQFYIRFTFTLANQLDGVTDSIIAFENGRLGSILSRVIPKTF